MSKKALRKINIRCDFAREIYNLFLHFSGQLSDGYWENSRGDWGSYNDGYYEAIWNCFDFEVSKDKNFVVVLKNKPTYDDAIYDCEKFHTMADKEITDYLRTALIDSIDEAPSAFNNYSEKELEMLIDCINRWEVLPQPLPKLTHEELVKIVGYDFEYVK